MVDSPTDEYGFRQQELGTNTNTWGDDKLNEVLRAIAQTLGAMKSLTMTGDYTVTSTNYVTTADNKNRGFILTGTLSAASNLVVPSSKAIYAVLNSTTGGFAVTVKTSAGTGVTIPNGLLAWVYCNSTNVINLGPTYGGVTSPTNAGAIPNWGAVETAIANAGLPASAGTVLVGGTDTTAGYLGQKIAVAGDLALSTQNPGANEKALITHTPYWNAPRALDSGDSPVTALDRDILLLDTSGGTITVNLPASGRVKIVDSSGDAATNNVTVDPPGTDTATVETIDVNYFSAVWMHNGTNWDLA